MELRVLRKYLTLKDTEKNIENYWQLYMHCLKYYISLSFSVFRCLNYFTADSGFNGLQTGHGL